MFSQTARPEPLPGCLTFSQISCWWTINIKQEERKEDIYRKVVFYVVKKWWFCCWLFVTLCVTAWETAYIRSDLASIASLCTCVLYKEWSVYSQTAQNKSILTRSLCVGGVVYATLGSRSRFIDNNLKRYTRRAESWCEFSFVAERVAIIYILLIFFNRWKYFMFVTCVVL